TINGVITAAGQALDVRVPRAHFTLWHGFNAPLALSVLTILTGLLLFWFRVPVARVLAKGERVPSSGDAYLALLRGLNTGATRVTGIVQNGSLPTYAAVILLTAALAPIGALVISDADITWPDLVDTP